MAHWNVPAKRKKNYKKKYDGHMNKSKLNVEQIKQDS